MISRFKVLFQLVVHTVLVVGLFACSSNSMPKPEPLPRMANTEPVSVAWDIGILAPGLPKSFIPVIDGNAIFTADSDGEIFRIDQTDGTVINKFRIRRKFSSGTATSSDSIFVTTRDAYLLAVDKATGKIRWQAQLPTVSIEAPQVSGDTVLVRTNDAAILAYNVHGSLLWVYQRPIPPLTLRAYNTFQIIGSEVVLVGQSAGRLALLNLSNGAVIWENYISMPKGATDLDKLTDIAMRPVLSDKVICVATYNGKIACLDAISSNIIWAKNFSSSSGLLIDQQNVYSVNTEGVVYAFDKSTGAVVWINEALRYRVLSIPVFLGNNILLIDIDGNILLLSRGDGKLVARLNSYLEDGIAYPWSDGKRVYIQTGNGHLAEITQ